MRVLIIGSLTGELAAACRIAIGRGAKLLQADTVNSGLAQLRAASADLVLCDVMLDVGALVAALSAERIAVPVVACGVGNDSDRAVAAVRAGAKDYLPLPADGELIAAMLQAVADDSRAMIARDPSMRTAIARAEQVARSEASILIAGESGTGKEVMARHIHLTSKRAGGPFIALNCAAIPDNLLESELFGHEKGAFTGAVARRVGKFEAAEKGTLLLDEISEMDIRLQAKLLRAIQEREIDRLGGDKPVKIDVRLIATTNRDLDAEVKRGTFREDLYFRLNVVQLRLPSLRERPGDIALLAEHFAKKYAEVNGVPARPLTQAAIARLEGHRWRGNVRELENTIHRAVLLAWGDAIGPEAIELTGEESARPAPPPGMVEGQGLAPLIGRTVADVERDLILETLTHCLGNRTQAATILGISIRTLRNKLREYASAGLRVPPPQGPAAGPATGPQAAVG